MRTHRRSSALAAAIRAQSWSYNITGGTARPSPAVPGAYAGAGDGDVDAFGLAGGLARAARCVPGALDRDDRLTPTASRARRLTANQRR